MPVGRLREPFAAHREASNLRSRMHSRARRRPARAGAAQALYTSYSDTDTSQKSKFNNSNYLLRICRSSAPAIRATPATMQFIIHNDAKLSKLTPAQQLTAPNRSGGFSSRETHRTQPALKTTNPARPWARGRPQRGGEADKTPAPADWQPTPNRCKRPWGIGPGLWTTLRRPVGESDRRHLSRGPMSAAIEQSWPYTSYPGQPASSISIVHQSKRLHVELPHQGQQAARARGVAGGGVAGGGVAG